MPWTLKRNAVIVFVLALLFYTLFMFAKHAPGLRDVIPFGEDPYDAVGSFGAIVAVLVALLSLVRALRPYRGGPASAEQRGHLARAQTAVVLCVLITVLADVVAMARDPSRWIGAPARSELLALIVGLTVAATTVQIVLSAAHTARPASRPGAWMRPAIVAAVAALILAVYPAWLIRGTLTHLLTVVVGALVLFAPMPSLLRALVPISAPEGTSGASPTDRRGARGKGRWMIVALVGIAVGVFAFAGEMGEGGGPPARVRIALVAVVFIGLATAGLLVAYAFLGEPLGLGRRR